MSRPKGEPGDPIVPEDVGVQAATALLAEIYRVRLISACKFINYREVLLILQHRQLLRLSWHYVRKMYPNIYMVRYLFIGILSVLCFHLISALILYGI